MLRFALLARVNTGPATSSGTEGLTVGAFDDVMAAVLVNEPAVVAVASNVTVMLLPGATLAPVHAPLHVTVPLLPMPGFEVGAGLADELQLVVAPFFVGDSAAPRFVHNGQFTFNSEHPMKLAEARPIGDVVLLRYQLS